MSVYAITLAFCNPGILLRSIEAFYRSRNPSLPIEKHFIVDQHYPLHRAGMDSVLERLCEAFPVTVIDPGRNLGLHHGFNWAMRHIETSDPDAVVIGYDPDSLPVTPGWDEALVRAIRSRRTDGETVVWSSLANPRTISDIHARGFDRAKADGGLDLWLTRTSITNSVCAWRMSWLRRVGGLKEPRAYYGHLEAAMFDQMLPHERWAVLPGWGESDELRRFHDREYTAYKWHHSHTQRWPGDFESFVKAGCPALEDSPLEIP